MTPSRSHARLLDQFYTSRPLAVRLVAVASSYLPQATSWIEPSAGNGAFVDAVKENGLELGYAVDLYPARQDIEKSDFLQWLPDSDTDNEYASIGNPPFGKNASLAVKFFNHAATFSCGIAMIFPRTFQKRGLQNRLDDRFTLVYEEVLASNSFVFEGQSVDVPCVFQVWKRLPAGQKRSLHEIVRKHEDFSFVDRQDADFAFQRVGVKAGAIKEASAPVAEASHLFIRATSRDDVSALRERFSTLDWSEFKHNTAGNPSIGKGEIVEAYTDQYPVAASAS